ncbi:hypothetical protein FNV43_RR19145 [Rhamnella rubrinervis]|uniref:Strictosidine synthase conserved region domain-containing protein n=1 Tax=Rhamnella rubrinervis TaxID=2594499 RepID=A0A8K0GW87_9ROSA|nr:hypothetical protein FNV43_RR19145 [Rhamnella rubrinervis]
MPQRKTNPDPPSKKTSWPFNFLVFFVIVPVSAALVLYQLDSFDPAPLPVHELVGPVATSPKRNERLLHGSELVGVGSLLAPEDVAYDSKSGLIYTGCMDGWIKRVTVNESATESLVENWVNTGGRPLGLAHGLNNQVIVADADKGLLSISEEGKVEVLTDEAEGVKFKLTDCVDIATDGIIYFTDASHKYSLKHFAFDILEGKPNGRLMSYDPTTKQTKVLLHDLYFANGIAVSPDQSYLIFCETTMRRCRKYHLQGRNKGSVDKFIDRLPGMPDNIRYDGEGLYWIALVTEITPFWNLAVRHPFIRKVLAIMDRYVGRPQTEKNSGVFAVDLEGKPVAHYYDPGLSLLSTGIKIGNHLYCGSVVYPYIIRLNLEQHPAQPTS